MMIRDGDIVSLAEQWNVILININKSLLHVLELPNIFKKQTLQARDQMW